MDGKYGAICVGDLAYYFVLTFVRRFELWVRGVMHLDEYVQASISSALTIITLEFGDFEAIPIQGSTTTSSYRPLL